MSYNSNQVSRHSSEPTVGSDEGDKAASAVVEVLEVEEAEPVQVHVGSMKDYNTMKWPHLCLLLLAETISLGIFALPKSLSKLGIVAGTIAIIVFGCISTWTGVLYADFRNANPGVRDAAGAGEILFKRFGDRWSVFGRWLFGVCADLVLIFIMAAHIISFALLIQALSPKGDVKCRVIWMFLGTTIQLMGTLPRTLKSTSYLSAGSCISVLIAVMVVMVDVGIRKPRISEGTSLRLLGGAGFVETMIALLNIVTSYTGHVAYLTLASELKDPREFKKSLYMQMSVATCLYTLVAIVIYYFVGDSVASPALGSASHKAKKAAWGIAMVTVIVGGVVNGAVISKHIYTTFCPNWSKERGSRGWLSWAGIVSAVWVLAWMLAEVVPSFHHILALLSALFGSWFSFGIPALMWFHLHGNSKWKTHRITACIAGLVFLLCVFLSFGGLAATIVDLMKQKMTGIFKCSYPVTS